MSGHHLKKISDGLQVSISNALIGAAQGLTLAEKRVMMFAVSRLDSVKSDGGISNGIVKLSALDYAKEFSVSSDTAYSQLKEASNHLFERYIRFFEDTPKGKKEIKIRWVGRAEYQKDEGWVALRFTADVQPFLTALKAQFTTYRLSQASGFKSLYSWRLLEIISQYKATGWIQIDLDKFLFAMEAPAVYQTNFVHCRKRIIDIAVKELTEKDFWDITWTPIKTGRKVTAIRFEFERATIVDGEAEEKAVNL